MTRRVPPLLALMALALPLGNPPAGAAPPAGGTVSIAATTADGEYDPSLTLFVDAVTADLTELGFTILDQPGHAASTLDLVLGRSDVGTAPSKVAGQSKVFISGGVVVPFSTGKSDLVPIRRFRLDLRLRKRGEALTVWRGTAVTVREAGTEPAVASDLARALLQRYPAEPRSIVGVP